MTQARKPTRRASAPAREPTRRASAPAREPDGHLVVFSLHGEAYAIPIALVREIVRYSPPSATAAASGLIQGVIKLRGRVVPLADLSARLGRTAEITPKTRILVIELAGGAVGLIVDSVEGVHEIRGDQLERLPAAIADNGLGDQIAALGDRLIMVLDPDRVLGSALGSDT